MPRAALYLRVSTERQTAGNQVAEVHQLALARGFEPVVYEEVESAAKARRSMVGAIQTVLELDRLGVPVLSVREGWLDTSGPVRPLLVAIFGWVGEQERTRLIERTKAGLERARREGKRIGRPPASPVLLHAARDLVAEGVPVREAARRKGVARSTLRRFLTVKPPATGVR